MDSTLIYHYTFQFVINSKIGKLGFIFDMSRVKTMTSRSRLVNGAVERGTLERESEIFSSRRRILRAREVFTREREREKEEGGEKKRGQ